MTIDTTAGTRLFISPTPVNTDDINALSDSAAIDFFEAINDWIEVEEVEEFGEVGDSSQPITFTAIKNRRVRKLKGPRDAGTQVIVVGRDALDDGQEAFIAAEKTDFNYAVKMVFTDAPSPSFADTVMYYAGMVISRPTNVGNVSSVTRRTFNFGINTSVFEVVPEAQVAPTNVTRPSITGTSLAQGSVLTAHVGTWTGNPTSYAYQWQKDTDGNGTFSNISGSTAATHTIAAGQATDAIRVQVTAINAAGSSSAANSLPVGLAGS